MTFGLKSEGCTGKEECYISANSEGRDPAQPWCMGRTRTYSAAPCEEQGEWSGGSGAAFK